MPPTSHSQETGLHGSPDCPPSPHGAGSSQTLLGLPQKRMLMDLDELQVRPLFTVFMFQEGIICPLTEQCNYNLP